MALAAAALLFVLAPSARGGGYRAAVCDPGLGAYHADAAFERSSRRYASDTSCGIGGEGLTVRRRGGHTRTGASGAWVIRAPAATAFAGLSAKAAGRARGGEVPELLAGAGAISRPFAQPGQTLERFRWSGDSASVLAARLRCGRPTGCARARGSRIRLKRVALVLRDRVRPRLGLWGALIDPGSRRGFEAVGATASDRGGGIRRFLLQVNGEPISSRTISCHLRERIAIRLVPCPRRAGAEFSADTSSAPFRQGPNRVRLCVADYALTTAANRACERRRVRVDNLCPVGGSGAGAVLRARLHRHGRRATIAGRLLDEAGMGVAGARVCVATRVRRTGVRERVAAVAATETDGRFRASLAEGPSREVRVAWWPHGGDALERYLHLEVPATPRLHLWPDRPIHNGGRVHFRVRLPGPASEGRRVRIQAASGRHWLNLRSGLTGSRGTYRAAYRFHATTGRRTYRFRAIVPKQDGYPYEAGASKVRRALVIG